MLFNFYLHDSTQMDNLPRLENAKPDRWSCLLYCRNDRLERININIAKIAKVSSNVHLVICIRLHNRTARAASAYPFYLFNSYVGTADYYAPTLQTERISSHYYLQLA